MVVPCGLHGRPLGPAVSGTARFVPEEEVERAEAAVAANWTPVMRVLERGMDKGASGFGIPSVYVEVTPDPS